MERKQASNAARISQNLKKCFKIDYVYSPATVTAAAVAAAGAAESMAMLDRWVKLFHLRLRFPADSATKPSVATAVFPKLMTFKSANRHFFL